MGKTMGDVWIDGRFVCSWFWFIFVLVCYVPGGDLGSLDFKTRWTILMRPLILEALELEKKLWNGVVPFKESAGDQWSADEMRANVSKLWSCHCRQLWWSSLYWLLWLDVHWVPWTALTNLTFAFMFFPCFWKKFWDLRGAAAAPVLAFFWALGTLAACLSIYRRSAELYGN